MSTGRGEVRDNERVGAGAAPAGRQAKLTDRSTTTHYGSRSGPTAPAGRQPMNFVRDVVEAAAPEAVAVVERTHSGDRREHTFASLAERSPRLAGTLQRVGVRRGDVVLLLIGNRIEWVESLLACFRIGAVALPCNEQLRAPDLAHRLAVTTPAAVIADERNRAVLEAASPTCPVLLAPTRRCTPRTTYPALSCPRPTPVWSPSPAVRPGRRAPTCTGSATCSASGCRTSTGSPPDPVSWPGVPPLPAGRSRRATPSSRPGCAGRPRCYMTPGSIRPSGLRWRRRKAWRPGAWPPPSTGSWPSAACSNRIPSLHSLVAAGEALDPETLRMWREGTGVDVRDGYGQTETGQVTANPYGVPARPGSMGRPLPGVRAFVDAGELVVDPATVPTFFLRYLGQPPPAGRWRTGDQVRQDDGYLYFEGRTDDVIISAGYRIGPFEVESVLARH